MPTPFGNLLYMLIYFECLRRGALKQRSETFEISQQSSRCTHLIMCESTVVSKVPREILIEQDSVLHWHHSATPDDFSSIRCIRTENTPYETKTICVPLHESKEKQPHPADQLDKRTD